MILKETDLIVLGWTAFSRRLASERKSERSTCSTTNQPLVYEPETRVAALVTVSGTGRRHAEICGVPKHAGRVRGPSPASEIVLLLIQPERRCCFLKLALDLRVFGSQLGSALAHRCDRFDRLLPLM